MLPTSSQAFPRVAVNDPSAAATSTNSTDKLAGITGAAARRLSPYKSATISAASVRKIAEIFFIERLTGAAKPPRCHELIRRCNETDGSGDRTGGCIRDLNAQRVVDRGSVSPGGLQILRRCAQRRDRSERPHRPCRGRRIESRRKVVGWTRTVCVVNLGIEVASDRKIARRASSLRKAPREASAEFLDRSRRDGCILGRPSERQRSTGN